MARSSIEVSAAREIVNGVKSPVMNATRAQAAKIIYSLLSMQSKSRVGNHSIGR